LLGGEDDHSALAVSGDTLGALRVGTPEELAETGFGVLELPLIFALFSVPGSRYVWSLVHDLTCLVRF
jgi:hypothetical protein